MLSGYYYRLENKVASVAWYYFPTSTLIIWSIDIVVYRESFGNFLAVIQSNPCQLPTDISLYILNFCTDGGTIGHPDSSSFTLLCIYMSACY